MALTSSDVYSPQNPGLATVLGSQLGPLRVYQQEVARQSRERQTAARLAKQQEAAEGRNVVKLEADGWSPYQEELNAALKEGYKEQVGIYADPTKPLFQKQAETRLIANGLKQRATRTKDIDAARKEAIAQATDSRYNKPALIQAINKAIYETDDDGNEVIIPSHKLDTRRFTDPLTNPDYYNPTEVVNKWLNELGTHEHKEYTQAARAGAAGRTRIGDSNIFAYDEQARPLYTLNSQGQRVRQIANLGLLEEAAVRDPYVAGLLRKQLQAGQYPSAARLMGLPVGEVSDADLEALNAQTDTNTPHSRQVFADLLREYGTVKESNNELSPKTVRQPRAGTAQQLKAGQATATPTSDFGLSVGDSGQPIVETVDNPKKGGLLNFFTPKVQRTTKQVQTFDNHYPHTGVSFATEKSPYVPLVVDSNELTTLGADGTPSHYSANKTNSQVKLNATDRSFVLEINGKRLGLNKAGTSADAYQEMRKLIDDMTPAQARQAVMKAYYHGSVVDKGAVSGDGAGGKAKLLGYKGESGRLLTEAEAAASKREGVVLTPVYDTKERQVKVMRPATAQLDAQAARQTPGYNPRQRTPQEADLIQRLEAKGGRVVDPYHTTKSPVADRSGGMLDAPTTTGKGPLAQRMAQQDGKLRIGKADPLGFGTARKESADALPTRGGGVYKAPKKQW
jgi:hypothetical protein